MRLLWQVDTPFDPNPSKLLRLPLQKRRELLLPRALKVRELLLPKALKARFVYSDSFYGRRDSHSLDGKPTICLRPRFPSGAFTVQHLPSRVYVERERYLQA